MNFDIKTSIQILEKTPSVLKELLKGLPEEWIRKNEGGDTWSPYDVLGHLIHGEKTDWIPRTKIVLSDSLDKNFEPFDRFAQEKEDQKRPIEELLGEFEELRSANLRELKSMELEEDQFQKSGIHPEFGQVNLRQLLSTWMVHDLGHIMQISRVMAKQYEAEVGPWKKYLRVLNE